MIGRLTGRLLACSPGRLLLDVSGVGYDVRIPLSTFYAIAPGQPDSEVSLSVHTHVREDALELFGFSTDDERFAFETLIGISGVGPRLALAILSGIGVVELRAAVVDQDRARLQKIPGVGKKTAERLLLELRDKLADRAEAGHAPGAAASAAGRPGYEPDAVSALVNLGYTPDVARRAVDRALEQAGSDVTLEAVLRAALGSLVR